MAKKAKNKKKSTRRRRVSGVALSAKSPIVQFGSIAAGYLFLGDKINTALANVTGSIDPKIIAAVEVVGGFLLKKKMKGTIGQVAGGVLIGAGAKKALQEFGVISGLPTVGGYSDLRTVNGLPAPVRKVAGLPGQGMSPSMQVIGAISNEYNDN